MLSPEQSNRVDEILGELSRLMRELDKLMGRGPAQVRAPAVSSVRKDRRSAKVVDQPVWTDFLAVHPELTGPAQWPTDDEIVRALRWAIRAGDRFYRRLGRPHLLTLCGATDTDCVRGALWGVDYNPTASEQARLVHALRRLVNEGRVIRVPSRTRSSRARWALPRRTRARS